MASYFSNICLGSGKNCNLGSVITVSLVQVPKEQEKENPY